MKRIFSLFTATLLCFAMVFSMAGCSISGGTGNEGVVAEKGLDILASLADDFQTDTKEQIAEGMTQDDINDRKDSGNEILENLDELETEMDTNEDGLDEETLNSIKEKIANIRATVEATIQELDAATPKG